MNKLSDNIPPLKKKKIIKKAQEKVGEIKIKLQTANQNWNDWKLQIHWNKLEWLNPIYLNERKKSIFCVF